MNHKPCRTFSRLHLLALLGPQIEITDFRTLSYTSTFKSLPFDIPKARERYPSGKSLLVKAIMDCSTPTGVRVL